MSRAAFLTVALIALAGCSEEGPDMPDLGQVHGLVTLDSKPLPNVTVYFKPDSGRPSLGKTDSAGNYVAKYRIDKEGVKVGPNHVHLEWGIDDSGPAIPPKFGAKSDMKLDVKGGDNEFNIDAVSAAPKK